MISIQGQAIRERYLALDRLAAFVDGVFAIAATLLALEVTVPVMHEAATGADLASALLKQWPSYAAYSVTFFLVGAYWINHHRMFNLLRGANHTFLVLNNLFLMAIAIIPFPNALVAAYLPQPKLRGVASAVYGIATLALAVMFNVVWWYAYRRGLFKPGCPSGALRKVLTSYLVGPVFYSMAIAVSFVAPLISLAMYVLIAIGYWAEGPAAGIDEGYVIAGEWVAGEQYRGDRDHRGSQISRRAPDEGRILDDSALSLWGVHDRGSEPEVGTTSKEKSCRDSESRSDRTRP